MIRESAAPLLHRSTAPPHRRFASAFGDAYVCVLLPLPTRARKQTATQRWHRWSLNRSSPTRAETALSPGDWDTRLRSHCPHERGNSTCPNAQLSILNPQLSTLNSQLSTLSSQLWTLDSRLSRLPAGARKKLRRQVIAGCCLATTSKNLRRREAFKFDDREGAGYCDRRCGNQTQSHPTQALSVGNLPNRVTAGRLLRATRKAPS